MPEEFLGRLPDPRSFQPQKIKNLMAAEAGRLAGEDPDYAIRDLYNAIERGEYPQWKFYIQVQYSECLSNSTCTK